MDEIGALLDAYIVGKQLGVDMHEESDDDEVPPAMRTGEVFAVDGTVRAFPDGEQAVEAIRSGELPDGGMVGWRMLPTTVTPAAVAAVEAEFGVHFPPPYRAYLMARAQLIGVFRSRRHGQVLRLPCLPTDNPLGPLRELLRNWGAVIPAGFVPCGTYGDEEWAGLFFDSGRPNAAGDMPVVALDHEWGVRLDADAGRREAVLPHVEPLYDSCRALLVDILTPGSSG